MILSDKKLSDFQKEALFLEMNSLLSSGLSFSRTFDLLIMTEKKPSVKNLLSIIYNSIIKGSSLWESMTRTGFFTNLDCGVVRIGEETGKLERSLTFLSEYYKKRIFQRRLIVGAVSYPIIILITALIVLTFMVAVVVPMFKEVYKRMGGDLPYLTKLIISLSNNFDVVSYITISVVFICGMIHLYYRNDDSYKKLLGSLALRLPLIGSLVQKSYEGQFCKLLYLLYSSGVPLISGINMINTIIPFYPYRTSFLGIEEGIKRGDLLSTTLKQYGNLYSTKFVTLVSVGEETNKLSDILLKQSDDINGELEYKFKQLGSILEPVLILVVGVLVAIILISMYLPMFKLGGTIS